MFFFLPNFFKYELIHNINQQQQTQPCFCSFIENFQSMILDIFLKSLFITQLTACLHPNLHIMKALTCYCTNTRHYC